MASATPAPATEVGNGEAQAADTAKRGIFGRMFGKD